jgi:LPPG:FO 2-phospho-L-lactate transferase
MCDETVQTYIKTPNTSIHFEEYYIKHKCEPEILDVSIKGIEKAKPILEVTNLIKKASKIIICPSNPIVSIGTILQIEPYRRLIKRFKKKVYAISPIVEGSTVKGPADKLLKMKGYEVTAYGVAKFYEDLIGTLIIDEKDSVLKSKIQEMGIDCYCFDTIMSDLTKKKNLAKFVINLE